VTTLSPIWNNEARLAPLIRSSHSGPFTAPLHGIGLAYRFLCRFLGRRDDEVIHGLWRPASEKRQGTKSREVGGGGAADAMGII